MPRTAGQLQDFKVGALAGTVDPGDLDIRRSIEPGNGLGIDEARFTGPVGNYTITTPAAGVRRVEDNVGTDGIDTVLRVEQLRFQNDTLLDLTDDTIVNVASAVNIPATGTVAITTANAQTAFRQGNILTATQNINDPNGLPPVASGRCSGSGQPMLG